MQLHEGGGSSHKTTHTTPGNQLVWRLPTCNTEQEQHVKPPKCTVTQQSVLRGIPQNSVLGLILFAIGINNIVNGVQSYTSLFADDCKLQNRVRNMEDGEALQRFGQDMEMEL